MHWKLSQPNLPVNSGQIVDWLLENRDITKKSEFLKPRQPSQYLAAEVGINQVELVKAAARIRLAIQNKQRVIIFGDYDGDGVSATAILWEAIKVAGLITQPFIPHRINHGYGLSLKALTEIFNQDNDSQKSKPDLIITVDNGIVAYEALEFLKNLGVEVIVTDHHQPDTKLLPVLATVHTTQLSGAGVAWFLARELCPEVSDQWLDLVTIATIADQMPVLAANRAFIVAGLKILNQRVARPGLKALFKVAEVDPKNLTAEQLSFSLIPRLNAMGRVADGIDALRMLCIKSADKAEALAAKLQVTNLARQELTLELMKEADQQAKSQQSKHGKHPQ